MSARERCIGCGAPTRRGRYECPHANRRHADGMPPSVWVCDDCGAVGQPRNDNDAAGVARFERDVSEKVDALLHGVRYVDDDGNHHETFPEASEVVSDIVDSAIGRLADPHLYAETRRLTEQVRVLRAVVSAVEWRGGNCPSCGALYRQHEHEEGCDLRAALAATEAP